MCRLWWANIFTHFAIKAMYMKLESEYPNCVNVFFTHDFFFILNSPWSDGCGDIIRWQVKEAFSFWNQDTTRNIGVVAHWTYCLTTYYSCWCCWLLMTYYEYMILNCNLLATFIFFKILVLVWFSALQIPVTASINVKTSSCRCADTVNAIQL